MRDVGLWRQPIEQGEKKKRGGLVVEKDIHRLFSLEGKSALVTGAGSGLGRAIAEAYAQLGAKVACVDISAKDAEAVCGEIVKNGGGAIAVVCNVSRSEDVRRAVETSLGAFSAIDILVNNAGIGMRSNAEDMTDEMWDRVLDINLKGVFLFCREVGRHMIERGEGGRIINMASVGGLVGLETGNANYCASKGGVIAMTRTLALEWAKHKILVNAIAPSHTRTPFIEKLMERKPEVKEYFLNNIPLGRLAEPLHIVGPAIFLASEAASFITGHTLVVDGGHTAR
jgi:NAD(P)-dependent dehydrogenase (short-subunit alcohol dehydrogenase family)